MSERAWRRLFWGSAVLALLLAASLAPYLTSSTELVRLRNALLYETAPAVADWTPARPPESFLLERARPTPMFERIVEAHDLKAGDDWETALRIGRHLLQRADGSGTSGPIQRDLAQTYRGITEAGDGYCGDYVDVFTALATTAGVFARSWAFSFDGYGGHGHIFNEIWNRQTARWQMIDVFNNYYVLGEDGRPLSALEFREALAAGREIRWQAVNASARPGFKYPEKALEYYRRGVGQWYLWWGNNVFAYDADPLVDAADSLGPSVAQVAAIAKGVHPRILAIHEPGNELERSRLVRTGYHLMALLVMLPVLGVVMLYSLWRLVRQRAFRGKAGTFEEGPRP